jgi:iron complex outermembrane receptor protein
MNTLFQKLQMCASTIALTAAAALVAGPALAQDIETVTVTGTSIRGVQPVGTNLITLGAAEIKNTNAQTMWQVFKDLPAISNMGQATQGNSGGNSYNVPTIHNLGSSSSNSTLIVIDGHRLAPSTIKQAMMDTGILPINMVERVEVLPDGASATYGADAVAGVINIITRKRFEGLDLAAQAGFADGYATRNASVLYGDAWNDSSLILAASYSHGDPLSSTARTEFSQRDKTPLGGTNFNSFSCAPAVIQMTGSSVYYLSADATTSYPTAQSGAMCNANAYQDAIYTENRTNAMMKFETKIASNVTFATDFVVGNREFNTRNARGTLQTTVFETGPQANPFYRRPAGYTGTATSQSVRWDSNDLLGPGTARTKDTSLGFNSHSSLNWDIDGNWHAELMGLYGWNYSSQLRTDSLCSSCANLALNGTQNAGGSTTTTAIPGTGYNTIVTQLPLTTSNALDVWNPKATNRTSALVRQKLIDNNTVTPFINDIQQYRASIDGSLFALPAGDIRVAVGAEYQHWGESGDDVSSINIGSTTFGTSYLHLPLMREVGAAYGEALIPLISPEMNIPGMYKVSLDVAGRYDTYSDFGSTSNPKVGLDWEVVEGFKARANWATSFVAPQIIQVGTPARNGQGLSSFSATNQNFIVSAADWPTVVGTPGCSAAQIAANGGNCTITSALNGIAYQGNQVPLTPATGKTWSVGFDVSPSLIPGLGFSATLFNNNMSDMLTATNVTQAIASPSSNLIHFYPNGMTQAQLDAETPAFYVVGSLPAPSTLYYVINGNVKNFLFLDLQGVDASLNYNFDTDNSGSFEFGGNATVFTMFKQHAKGTTYRFDIKGAVGANGTFAAIPATGRFHVGWNYESFDIRAYANYTSGYRNVTADATKPVVNVNGRLSGGDIVKSNTTFDLHGTYTFAPGSLFGRNEGTEVFLDVQNVFDKDPVFFNGSTGYSTFTGNPIGRMITGGFRLHM